MQISSTSAAVNKSFSCYLGELNETQLRDEALRLFMTLQQAYSEKEKLVRLIKQMQSDNSLLADENQTLSLEVTRLRRRIELDRLYTVLDSLEVQKTA